MALDVKATPFNERAYTIYPSDSLTSPGDWMLSVVLGSVWALPAGLLSPVPIPKSLPLPWAIAKASILPTLAFTLELCPPSVKLTEDKLTPSPPVVAPPAAVSSKAFRSVPFKMACCKADISATVSLPKLSFIVELWSRVRVSLPIRLISLPSFWVITIFEFESLVVIFSFWYTISPTWRVLVSPVILLITVAPPVRLFTIPAWFAIMFSFEVCF